MALRVEVAGYGSCKTAVPYIVFVVCVQQENFEAWTVYRPYRSFEILREQLSALQTDTPVIPPFDYSNFNHEHLDQCRAYLDSWLQTVTSNAYILRMQAMYQFLCSDANMPPPYLEVYWGGNEDAVTTGQQGGDGEMNMDEMFHGDNGEMEEQDDEDDLEDSTSNIGSEKSVNSSQPKNVFSLSGGGTASQSIRAPGMKKRPGDYQREEEEADKKDGLDIQSLSVVEAEVLFSYKESSSFMENKAAEKATINLEAFKIIKVVGKGSFGKVFLVREKASGTLYAMKVLKKDYIVRKNQVEHTKTERSVLSYVDHPYIVGLKMAFQTTDKLFFVLDYCAGGELFFHLGKVGRFDESRSKFYAAQIILALEYVHKMDVIYRDLKPENVLLDAKGNIRLTDFGLSKEGVRDHSSGANSFCGTPEYIAPEVLLRQGHGRAVDWWSLGALLYEMITGLPPFYSRNRDVMFDKIMKADLTFPPTVGPQAKDLLSRLLVRDPKLRMGSGPKDAEELKEHAFFIDINWEELARGASTVPSTWVPSVAGSLDTSQFDTEFTSMMPTVSPDVRDVYFGNAFEGFSYAGKDASHLLGKAVGQGSGGAATFTARGRTGSNAASTIQKAAAQQQHNQHSH